ncbi:MAG: pyrroline-5-carboxylate reductase [Clostridiales bacterium]|nr:pyrroline-5-carboxylate reductase [Clostridiales bacterium]
MNIGFIGCGNMASAIMNGVVASKAVSAKNIFCFDTDFTKTENMAAKLGINKCENETELVRQSDYVVLAVKPNVIASVLNKINAVLLEENAVLISIAAGKSIADIRNNLSHENKIIRVMPNINAKVNCAASAYCAGAKVAKKDIKFVEKIFSSVGTVTELDEKFFPLFGVLSGCAPAFVFMFIDSMARAGVQFGMKKDEALKIAAQTVLGSAEMVMQTGVHPYELIDSVCSPGGTTIEGVMSLKADGFESAVANAVAKSLDKDKKL